MKTLLACCALLPLSLTAVEPAPLPTDGRFVLELGLEVKNDDAQGELKTTLISQDARRLTTGDDGFAVSFGADELRAHVTADAVTDTAPRQFRVAVKLRHKEENVGGATITVLDGQQGQVRVTLNGDSEDRMAILLAVTVGDPNPPAPRQAAIPPAEAPTPQVLQNNISLNFEKMPLGRAVGFIRGLTNLNIAIDSRGLEEEGVTPDTPVSIDVKDVPLSRALELLLRPANLTHVIKDGVLEITSRTRAQGPLIIETYPVADLVIPIPRVVTAHAETDPADRHTAVIPAVDAGRLAIEFRQLAELITSTIEPGSWEHVGGQGVIRPNETTLSLVVRQTSAVHDQIGELIGRMRREQDVQVSLDMTLLRVPAQIAKTLDVGRGVRRLTAEERSSVIQASFSRVDGVADERLPKVTFFNGQTCQYQVAITRDGRQESYWLSLRALIAPSGVQLTVAPGTTLRNARSVTVPDKHPLLIDVTPTATGAGAPIILKRADAPRLVQADRPRDERFLLLVTPRIIAGEPESTSSDTPDPEPAAKGGVRRMGSHYFTLDVF